MTAVRSAIVVGAGVAGLCAALELARRGHAVTLIEADPALRSGCSWHGGGMLAPIAELSGGDVGVARRGLDAVARWRALVGDEALVVAEGGLVVVHRPEQHLLDEAIDRARRAGLDGEIEPLDAAGVAAREPWLAGRVHRGIFVRCEGLVHPRVLLPALVARLRALGATVHAGVAATAVAAHHVDTDQGRFEADVVVDARGLGARDALPLRGVRGEYIVVKAARGPRRQVRLMHPRYPCYVVPRPDGRLYIGATAVESEHLGGVHVRSVLELLSGVWSLDPSLADAEIEELGAGLRPAVPDNLPVTRAVDGVIRFNGLYRHGFLLAPALAGDVADLVEAG